MAQNPFEWLGVGAPETPQEVEQANEDQMRRAQEEIMNDARLYYRVFDTPDGRELIARLRDCTIEIPGVRVTGTVGGAEINMTVPEWMMFREGQNSVVRHIELQMKIATMPVAKPNEGNPDDN